MVDRVFVVEWLVGQSHRPPSNLLRGRGPAKGRKTTHQQDRFIDAVEGYYILPAARRSTELGGGL